MSQSTHPISTEISSGEPVAAYNRMAVFFHWLLALLLIAQIGFGFLLDQIAAKGTSQRGYWINLHKSVGLSLALLILIRLVWRYRHALPAWPASFGARQQQAAIWSHRLLYLAMLLPAASGYLASNFSKYGIVLWGIRLAPWASPSEPVYQLLQLAHNTSIWLLLLLVTGHAGMAIKHAVVLGAAYRRRMSPALLFKAGST